MKLKLKDGVVAALGRDQAQLAAEALDELASMCLARREHFCVTRLEVALCQKPEREQQEP